MQASDREKYLHDKLISVLKSNPKGLTMTDLVRITRFSRKAIEKHLEVLTLENEIYLKQFGNTKVYYPNSRIHHVDFEKLDLNNKTIWFDILENEFGIYLLIQKKKNVENNWVNESSITVPLENCEQFSKIFEKITHSQRVKALLETSKKSKQ